MNVSITTGILYVVATPIGNLEDISLRALRVLREVDWVAAEDTRHSKHLLQNFGITTPLISLHEHNERYRVSRLLMELHSGKSVALVSDAGTPLISDPGFHLVRHVRNEGLKIVPIPGPCSFTAALSVAGLPTDKFVFEGFLPAKEIPRRRRLQALNQEERTLVFFESSHRIQASLKDMAAVLGDEREAVLARELTKLFEDIHGDTLAGLCEWIDDNSDRQKGEFVIIIRGLSEPADHSAEARRLLSLLLEELPVKRAVAVAAKMSGLKRNALYDMALCMMGDK